MSWSEASAHTRSSMNDETFTMAITIVDDEAAIRVSLRRLCNALGFEATTYASGRDFLDALDRHEPHPHCILLDIHMAEMSGSRCSAICTIEVFVCRRSS
jgi:FixJ family two-component response regulator